MNDNIKEFYMELEKFLKTGRFSFAILTYDNKDRAVVNELIVKYDEVDHKPMLYIKNPNGDIVPIITESDALLKQFLENFLEISVDRTKSYEPSLWFMLRKDDSGDTGWNQSTIDQFYHFVGENMSKLKPYVLQTFKNQRRDIVIPFVDTKMVYYDMGKLIDGNGIENFDKIVDMLYNLIKTIQSNLVDVMNGIETKFNDLDQKLRADNIRQDNDINQINKQMSATETKLDEVIAEIGKVAGTTERRLMPVTITVGGSNSTIYPVSVKVAGGGHAISGGTEMFAGAMFLTMEDSKKHIVVQLGNDHMTDSPNYFSGSEDLHFVYSQKVLDGNGAKHYVYEVTQFGSGYYGLLLRGATKYTLWTRYPEHTSIVNSLQTIGGLSPIPEGNKGINPQLTDDRIIGTDITRTFTNSVHVVSSVMVGNQIKMSIGR